MFFDNIQTVFYSTFRAHGNLRYESTLIVISQFLTMIIGTAALFLHAPLVFLILAYTIPSALLAVYGFWAVARKYGIVIRLQIHRALIKTWLAWSWPFALAAILSRLYAYTDSIVISKMLPAEHLGWWSVPYKITFAFQFIAVSVSTSLYPAASALAGDSSLLRSKFAQAWHYLFLVALPLSLGLIAVAQPVIVRVFGKSYAPSAPILQILLLSLIFGFLSFITGAMLNATNRQRTQTALMASALVSNIILNFVLLPRFGLEGAAFAALIGNIILALGGYIACTQFLRLPHGQILAAFLKTLLAAGVMALLAHWLLAFLPLLAVIALAGFLYGVFAFMTGAITVEHILSVKQKLVSTP
jgi:O-antigen/teichoic acid export membrane protein